MNAHPDTAPAWRADRTGTPLLAWRGKQLAMLAGKIDAVLAAWASDWGIPPALCTAVDCIPAEDAGGVGWQGLGGAESGAAWVHATEEGRAQLAGALFRGAPQATPLIEEIAQACRSDAVSRLRSLLALPDMGPCAGPAHSALSAWSGSLVVSLPFGARLLLAADVVRKLVAAAGSAPPAGRAVASGALQGIPEAIGDRELRIEVSLEGCDIEIGALQDLQLGDVLRLRQGLDKPASVSVADGTPVFSGFLVRSRGRKAIELACVTS